MSHFAVLLRWRCCTQCGTVSFLRASARSAVRHQEDCRSERLNCSRILLRPRTLSARAYAAAAEHHVRTCYCYSVYILHNTADLPHSLSFGLTDRWH